MEAKLMVKDKRPENILKTFEEIFGISAGWEKVFYRREGLTGSIKTSFAMAFSDIKASPDDREKESKRDTKGKRGLVLHTTTIRKAFNSPFFPFVLSTTSIGQEGLDFHYYCKDIMHWNLPSPNDPVALEQRERRINRYNGVALRKNIARWARRHIRDNDTFIDESKNIWNEYFRVVKEECEDVERYNSPMPKSSSVLTL